MLTQVYEVTDPATARAVAAIGVDHIGAKVGDGTRPLELQVAQARLVKDAIGQSAEDREGTGQVVKFSALFMSDDVDRIAGWIAELAPDIAHFGANVDCFSPDDLARLKAAFPDVIMMRSIPMIGEESLAIAARYDRVAHFLMLDSVRKSDAKFGALGVTHDWDISRRIVQTAHCPVFLAGGLGPDNVAEAIRQVRPAGVDSKTKTDLDGGHQKDLNKVRRYHLAAKAAATALA